MKKMTQIDFVRDHIEKHGYITRNFCLRNYITRLGALIGFLEKEGYSFQAKYITLDDGSKDYKYLWLKDNQTMMF